MGFCPLLLNPNRYLKEPFFFIPELSAGVPTAFRGFAADSVGPQHTPVKKMRIGSLKKRKDALKRSLKKGIGTL